MESSRKGDYPKRAGFYAPTHHGWRAFHPKPLPPADPPLQVGSELMSSLSCAAIEVGRLDGAVEAFPEPDLFVYSYVRKEAVLSSQIEGTRSTLVDLLDFEAGANRASSPPDVLEVANYVRALTTALKRVRNGEPLSIRLLKDTHRTLFDRAGVTDFVPGELRDRQNWIGPLGSSPEIGRAHV